MSIFTGPRQFFRNYFLVVLGVAIGISYWLFDVFTLHADSNFFEEVFNPNFHENITRWAVLLLIISFSFFVQILFNKCNKTQEKIKLAHTELNQVFQTAADGMRIVDKDFNVMRVNKTFLKMTGLTKEEIIGKKCHEVFWGPNCHTHKCPLTRILEGDSYVQEESEKQSVNTSKITCIVTATPFRSPNGELLGIVEDFKDISERKKVEQERERLIAELKDAVEKIKTLSGIVPICMYCKQIRDDKGYWNQLEKFISEHSEAQFSHSICDKCMKEHYSELGDDNVPEL